MSKGKPIAFIDADILLHRAVSFCDDEFDGEAMADWKQAENFFDKILEKWLREAGPIEDYVLVISNGQNYRKDLYPLYKANRKDIVPHPAFAELKVQIMDRIDCVWEDGIEADDYIGIKCSEDKEKTLAVSADKDFATVPCNLMVPTSHGRTAPDWFSFTDEEADRNWLMQTMTGDVIDNYPGIYGVGKVAAGKLLDKPCLTVKDPEQLISKGPRKGQAKPVTWSQGRPCSPWQAIVSLAQSKGMAENDIILMAQLARILRHGEYNFETKEVDLWIPQKLNR
jgi:hypothetical protein